MAETFHIEIDDKTVLSALDRLRQAAVDPAPALREIGEKLVESTKQRFVSATAPDGSAWAENSRVTILRYLGKKSGSFKKNGSLSKKGSAAVGSKKPLTGISRNLSQQIRYAVSGGTLLVGSIMEYAQMQQFGGSKSKFPNLWGDIPARPFLGISDSDARMVDQTITEYLQSVIG